MAKAKDDKKPMDREAVAKLCEEAAKASLDAQSAFTKLLRACNAATDGAAIARHATYSASDMGYKANHFSRTAQRLRDEKVT